MSKLSVLLQVYSVREDAQRDFAGTLAKIKAIGYDGVELAGLYGQAPEAVRDAVTGAGLTAVSAHVPYPELAGDTEKTVKAYATIGCEFIAVPYLTEDLRPGGGEFEHVVKEIGRIGECCKKHGIQLLYHNHDFEFAKMPDDRFALDYIYDTVPAELLQTEIDTCWVNVAGMEPAAYVRKYAGRAPVVHLKDFYKEGRPANMYELIGMDLEKKESAGKFEFRPIGLGMQVMPELLEASEAAGARYVVVEQDASVGRTPMEAVTISRKYLALLGY